MVPTEVVMKTARLSLVAVFTGGNADERYLQPFEMMRRYVVPAVH